MTVHLLNDMACLPSDRASGKPRTGKWWMLIAFFLMLVSFSLYGQVVVNEIMASNATAHADPDQGTFTDWVEIYNAGSTQADLSGWFLSDDPDDTGQWAFPQGTRLGPYAYLLVYADGTGQGLHTSFKLSKEGETILLANAAQTVVDSVSYPPQLTDISYGRSRTAPSLFGFFEDPTPGYINGPDLIAGIADPPQFSLESGFYPGALFITLTSSTAGAEIRYTLDGTKPTAASPLYTGPLQLNATSVVRARSFASGLLTA